jgi:ABC-type branched-subunit amino acid transport system substrate-binding protein
VAVLLSTTACGSTVRLSGAPVAGDGLEGVPGAPTAAAPAATGEAGAPVVAGPSGTTPPAVAAATATATAGSSATALATAPTGAAGAHLAPVLIGYTTARDAQQVFGGLGVSGVQVGDIDAEAAVMARDLNARGGLLGHPVQLLNHDFSTANATTNADGEQQRACSDFTQDHRVALVADTMSTAGPILHDCLVRHRIPLALDGAYIYRNVDYAPGVFGPSLMSQEDYIPALAKGLKAAGWFTGWDTAAGAPSQVAPVKLGLLHFDDPMWNTYAALWKKQAASLGYPIADEVTYSHNLDNVAAAAQSAVLRFRADGVTHVVNANILFYKAADAQGFHPRYAVDDTLKTPQLLTQNVGASQLHGAMGVGYQPLAEVNAPGDVTTSTTRCKKLMAAGGQRPTAALAEGVMLGVCDAFWLLEALVEAGGGFTPADLDRGADRVGSSFVPTLTYAAELSSKRHAPAAQVRPFAYQDACGCFTYVGPRRHL